MVRSLLFFVLPVVLSLPANQTTRSIVEENILWQDTVVLPRDTIGIEEVLIERDVLSAEEQYERNKNDYRIIYLNGDNRNIIEGFGIFPPVIVINVNKLYNHFSVSGKRARSLQNILENSFKHGKVKESWYPITQQLTKLDGQQLDDFRRYYQPEFDWWESAEGYDRMDYVFKRLKDFQDSVVHIRTYLALPMKKTPSLSDR